MKKLIGETEDSVVVLKFRAERHFSLSGSKYDRNLFTEEEGEERAKDYLEDGELWRAYVEAENTTAGLDDWIEDVLRFDGWAETLGDVKEVQTKEGKWLYTLLGSCGQIDMSLKPEDFINPFIPMKEIKTIFRFWNTYHMTDLKDVPERVLTEMRRIFTPETTLNDWAPSEVEA